MKYFGLNFELKNQGQPSSSLFKKMSKKIFKKEFLLCISKCFSGFWIFSLLCLPLSSVASNHSANQDLRRALLALNAAKTYVAQAQSVAPKTTRVVFHYDLVNRDISRVMAGIEAKFEAASVQPRRMNPIKGDYLSMVGQKVGDE